MSWTIDDRFPSWGESGASPADGFFYEGGDQVNEKHLDYLWSSIKGLEDDIQAALNDIDSDSDGVVDKADTVASGGNLNGDLNAADGETIWDESASYIPQGRLQNASLSVNGGDGLKNGGPVSLGGSVSLDIEPADFAGTGVFDDGADNLELDESVIKDGGSKEIDASEFSGSDGVDGQILTSTGSGAAWETLQTTNEVKAYTFVNRL
jgi:hypothetical protein